MKLEAQIVPWNWLLTLAVKAQILPTEKWCLTISTCLHDISTMIYLGVGNPFWCFLHLLKYFPVPTRAPWPLVKSSWSIPFSGSIWNSPPTFHGPFSGARAMAGRPCWRLKGRRHENHWERVISCLENTDDSFQGSFKNYPFLTQQQFVFFNQE